MQPETTRPAVLLSGVAMTAASASLGLGSVASWGPPAALAGGGALCALAALGLYALDRGRLRRVGAAAALLALLGCLVGLARAAL